MRFSKLGKIRWTSHRDLARMWERAFRRASLPLAYTGGFSPRPKVSFGLALPTGHESLAEYLDLELDADRADGLEVAALPDVLSAALPAGVDVTAAAVIDDHAASLQHEVTSCTWEVVAAGTTEHRMRELVSSVLAAEQVVVSRERKGQEVTDDIRPALLAVTVLGASEAAHLLDASTDDAVTRPVALRAELTTQPRSIRPSELLAALDGSLEEVRVRRTHQWISRADGSRTEPLEAPPLDTGSGAPPPLVEVTS
ncbi:MAG TPA: TIGR03936 family radical SAM-associated protein [Acidimicrobiales bacterium]|nr:TIGR03936 family radical SAM-associated protein [Acidimicrobiales bacterium]